MSNLFYLNCELENILQQYGVIQVTKIASPVRRNAVACVAFNTCPLALAEAQRYLPSLIDKIEPLLVKHQLQDEEITLRMTGCPNGCGRSHVSEIGFVGTSYGLYNLHIGGDRVGERLNKKYKDNLNEEKILSELNSIFEGYSKNKTNGESFGDYTERLLASIA